MPGNIISNPAQILETAKTILLVDWPNQSVPRILLNAGFTVFGFSPGRYSLAEVVAEYPHDMNQKDDVFAPKNENDRDYLVFRRLDARPESVDIVNVYRPEEELAEIIENNVLPLNAKTLWLQPPVTSAKAKSIAEEHGLVFVEGNDIAEIARSILTTK